jgi:DNA polymerase-3 subunit delta
MVSFSSKKLYDNQVGDWIKRVWQARNMKTKANAMLVEFLGTDLSK